MKKQPASPAVADIAPVEATLTVYDEQHVPIYLRLLDAAAEGADWQTITEIVLRIDARHEPDRARKAFESHLARAKWMTTHGYKQLLCGGTANRQAST